MTSGPSVSITFNGAPGPTVGDWLRIGSVWLVDNAIHYRVLCQNETILDLRVVNIALTDGGDEAPEEGESEETATTSEPSSERRPPTWTEPRPRPTSAWSNRSRSRSRDSRGRRAEGHRRGNR